MKIISGLVFLLVTASVFTSHITFSKDGIIYSIHLLTLKTADEAKIKVKEFKDRGYISFFREEKSGDKEKIYNVYIERFNTRPEAEKEAKILKDLDLIADYDVRDITEKDRPEIAANKKDMEIENIGNIISNNKAPKFGKTGDNKTGAKPNIIKGVNAGTVLEQKEKGSYFLKVSSLKEKANADDVVRALQNSGYYAFYKFENVKGKGEWYRVYLDGFQTKSEAEKEANKLILSGIISGYEIIWKMKGFQPPKSIQENITKKHSLKVASFKDISAAEEEVRGFTESGFKAFFNNTKASGEQLFDVFIGEFSDEKEAWEKGVDLVQKGMISYFHPVPIERPSQDKTDALDKAWIE